MAMAKARWQVCAWVHGERHVTVYRGGVLGNFREPVSLTAPPPADPNTRLHSFTSGPFPSWTHTDRCQAVGFSLASSWV